MGFKLFVLFAVLFIFCSVSVYTEETKHAAESFEDIHEQDEPKNINGQEEDEFQSKDEDMKNFLDDEEVDLNDISDAKLGEERAADPWGGRYRRRSYGRRRSIRRRRRSIRRRSIRRRSIRRRSIRRRLIRRRSYRRRSIRRRSIRRRSIRRRLIRRRLIRRRSYRRRLIRRRRRRRSYRRRRRSVGRFFRNLFG